MEEKSCSACEHSEIIYLTTVDDNPLVYGIDFKYKCRLTDIIVTAICDEFEFPF